VNYIDYNLRLFFFLLDFLVCFSEQNGGTDVEEINEKNELNFSSFC